MQSNIENIACEKGFHDFAVKGVTGTMEPFFSAMESDMAPIIADIIEAQSLASIDRLAKAQLSVFLAVQFLRTRRQLDTSRDMMSALESGLTKLGFDPSKVVGYEPFNEEEARIDRVLSIPNDAKLYGYGLPISLGFDLPIGKPTFLQTTDPNHTSFPIHHRWRAERLSRSVDGARVPWQPEGSSPCLFL